jgi:hypothetical protein
MNYKTLIPAKKVNYVYRYTGAKKITDTTTAMASVEVYDRDGKKIGGYAFSRSPKNAFSEQVKYMVSELIRDYETRKIFNN